MRQRQRTAAAILAVATIFGAGRLLRIYTSPWQTQTSPLAPPFHLADLNGRAVSLSDYKGKVVLLNFWASWCDSCLSEIPGLNALYLRQRGPGFELLAASVDLGGRKAVMPFVARYSPVFPVLTADASTQAAYGVRELPSSFLIDAQGFIARRYIGPIDLPVLENDILQLRPAAKKT